MGRIANWIQRFQRGFVFLMAALAVSPVFAETNYFGKIGEKTKISLSISSEGNWQPVFDNAPPLQGFYFYDHIKKDILLLGKEEPKGTWVFQEFAEPGKPSTGTFIGKISKSTFIGEWLSQDGRRSLPFQLKARSPAWKNELRNKEEASTVSEQHFQQAFEALKVRNFEKALFHLRLSRLTQFRPMNSLSSSMGAWEYLLIGETTNAIETLKNKMGPGHYVQGKEDIQAYLLQESGNQAAAMEQYRARCELDYQRPILSCLMYAWLTEQKGDQKAARYAYDLACPGMPSVCSKAWGKDELDLIEAIKEGKDATAKELLKRPLNVDAKEGEALYQAVLKRNFDIVQLLITKHADPNLGHGRSIKAAVQNARLAPRQQIAEFLLDHGYDPKRESGIFTGMSALQTAVTNGNITLARKLLEKGAIVNVGNSTGQATPLIFAAENNDFEMVKLLLKYNADPTIELNHHPKAIDATTDPKIRKLLEDAETKCLADKTCGSSN